MQTLVPLVHIFSFSVWAGANLFVLGVLWPASRGLPPDAGGRFMRRAAGGLNRVAAVAAPLAVLSGLAGCLLPGAAAAQGAGAATVLAAKIVLTAVMALLHGLQAFRYDACPAQPLDDGRNPWLRLLAANGVLGVIVLLLGLALRRF